MIRALIVVAILTAGCAAQSQSYELDDTGQWVLVEAPEEGSDAALMAEWRTLIAEGKPSKASAELSKWISRNKRTDNSYLATAYLLRGDARAAKGNEYRALYDYERVILDFPSSPEFVTAVERELAIAIAYVHGMKRRALGFRIAGAQKTGERLLLRVEERMPGSQLAETAEIQLADYYFRSGDLVSANDVYEIFLRFHQNSRFRKHAMLRRVQASIGQFKGPKYDATMLTDAQLLIRDFKAEYPLDAERENMDGLLVRIEESKAAQQLEKARFYLQRLDMPSAKFMLERIRRDYPFTIAGRTAEDELIKRGWIEGPPSPDEIMGDDG